MGQMALGYGSEFHLLRWIGRHRNEFDRKINEHLKIDNVKWLDFEFDKNKSFPDIPDKELKGISFLKDELVINNWKKEWPQTGNVMNWDLVGFTIDNNIKTWLLVEAKAHIEELSQSCGATNDESKEKITNTLKNTAENLSINFNSNWLEKYYQLANRIYILDLLRRHNIYVKLINIYFIGDMKCNNRKSPQSKDEWLNSINEMKECIGIKDKQSSLGIYDIYLDVAE